MPISLATRPFLKRHFLSTRTTVTRQTQFLRLFFFSLQRSLLYQDEEYPGYRARKSHVICPRETHLHFNKRRERAGDRDRAREGEKLLGDGHVGRGNKKGIGQRRERDDERYAGASGCTRKRRHAALFQVP